MPSSLTRLGPELARIAPRELLVSEAREREISGVLVGANRDHPSFAGQL
jgi:hypothetical protein